MKRLLIGSISVLLLFSYLIAREAELRPYRLINSDYLTIDLVNEEYITRLNGNVHFFYGDTEFFADEAEIFEVRRIVRMKGNVKVFDDSLSLNAQEVEYFRLTEELKLYRDVFINEDHLDGTIRTFQADSARYDRNNAKIFAYESIEFFDEREAVFGVSNFLDYDLDSGYGFLTGQPVININRDDTLRVAAERIEFYRDFNRLSASFDVRTHYADYLINSNFLLFFIDDSYAVFMGEPSLHSDLADAQAERFYLYFEDNKLSRATLENNCRLIFALKEGGEKENKVTAKLMELLFTDGKMTGLKAYENVKSLYIGGEDREAMVNNADSEKLEVMFDENNEIENIIFIGKVRGTYKFNNQVLSQ